MIFAFQQMGNVFQQMLFAFQQMGNVFQQMLFAFQQMGNAFQQMLFTFQQMGNVFQQMFFPPLAQVCDLCYKSFSYSIFARVTDPRQRGNAGAKPAKRKSTSQWTDRVLEIVVF